MEQLRAEKFKRMPILTELWNFFHNHQYDERFPTFRASDIVFECECDCKDNGTECDFDWEWNEQTKQWEPLQNCRRMYNKPRVVFYVTY